MLKNGIKFRCAKRRNKKENPEGHLVMLKFMALALLPPSKIYEGLIDLIRETMHDYPSGTYIRFIIYFIREWIIRTGIKKFCVYKLKHRTNNTCEVYHSKLDAFFRKSPAPSKFVGKKKNINVIPMLKMLINTDILNY